MCDLLMIGLVLYFIHIVVDSIGEPSGMVDRQPGWVERERLAQEAIKKEKNRYCSDLMKSIEMSDEFQLKYIQSACTKENARLWYYIEGFNTPLFIHLTYVDIPTDIETVEFWMRHLKNVYCDKNISNLNEDKGEGDEK